MKKNIFKKALSLLLCVTLIMSYIPIIFVSTTMALNNADRRVDPSTMDVWKEFFGEQITSTKNAGRVWTDKSVFTDTSAFPNNTVSMLDSANNFLVALSAISANKEIVGYSTIPTDTMLVLDVSGSMDDNASTLVAATNDAIQTLLDTNRNNRVGVILYSASGSTGTSSYSQSTTVILPLDRYTTGSDGTYLTLSGSTVSVSRNLRNSDNESVSASKSVTGGTYIQSGLYAAMLEFQKADTVVESNNFQGGQDRLPILVLMSDGAPTTGNSNFTSVNSSNSNIGNGGSRSATDAMGFITQLTASYVLNRIEAHYGCADKGLFYTLGLDVGSESDTNVAVSVLDPANSTSTINSYWRRYLALDGRTALQITAPGTRNSENPGTKTVSIYKNAYAVNQFYTDKYFPASNTAGLTNAFKDIVDEIILQSRYYPTDLEGGHPDFSGYLRFEDRIGDYMDVKDIKGILIGDTFFDGDMMASNFTSSGSLGSIEDPTELGLEFINAVKTRLGITDNTTVFTLVTEAYRTKQLYSDANGWSNYIGWYAAADGSFLGHYNEGTTTAPTDAVYKVKSYGFLGKSDGNIKDSDMMYMSVQLRINIESGEETLAWSIPAALVPIVTYKVSLEGTNIASATNVSITREEADPIRLIYEIGLDSRYNELNIHTVTDPKHVADDGSRIFWTNYWDNSAAEHTDHVATESMFTPSEQNELYYYISDSLIYEKDGSGNYLPVSTNGALDQSKTYYHSYYVFSTTSSTPIVSYLQIHENTLAKAEWRDDYKVSATDTGAYVIPIGTPYQFIEEELYIAKESNVTKSIIFSDFPYVNITNASSTAGVKLGNNGLLTVKPASGIKLSKTIDTVEPGASDLFTFRITLTDASGRALEGTYNTLLADLDKTEGESGSITFTNGVADINLRAGKTVYITGLPVGAVYTVEEISVNTAYKIKDVHLNGQSLSAKLAAGTVKEMSLEDVKFINTPTSDGNLVITKRVTHPFGADYTVPSSITFKAKITLIYGGSPLAGETFDLARSSGITSITTDENGEFTVTLTNGESVSVHNIPEETEYTVTEIELPDGFTLDNSASSALNGYISAEGNANAVLVNSYSPDSVSPEDNEIVVSVTKSFSGRDWKDGDVFEFTLEELHPVTRASSSVLSTIKITSASELTKLFDLTDELYDAAGTYYYRITEKVTSATNGITYDTVERRFLVTVTDTDMDGKLEISGVENVMNTVVAKNGNSYNVSATFANVYAPYLGTSVEFSVQKYISGHTFPLNGFIFGLYNESGEDLIVESTVTGANGIATFKLAYTASDVGTYTYVLKEIAGSINGMTYDTTEYVVTVVITDNGDGTTSASYTVTKDGNAVSGNPTFTNTYDPTDATLLISGNKVLTGRVQNENEFEFELYEITASGEVLLQTVKNSYVGDFVFDLLTFDTAGTYKYVVKEKNTGLGGVTYDTRTYSLTVTVVNENGVLVASSDLSGEIIFTNSYTPKSTSVSIVGNKILTGRDIRNGEFSFTITGPDNYSETVNNVGGRLYFSSLTFDKAGTYIYTVKENAGTVSGITYDKSVYTVTITVTDDGVGALHAAVSYKDDNAAASGIVFRNGYSPAPIDIEINGSKDLIGRDVLNGEFEFILSNAVNGAQIESTTNIGTSFGFSPYTVHTAGTYTFTVKEVDTGKGGVTYDTAIYTVAVTVVDDLNGKLVESGRVITRNGQSASDVEFVNVYNASPVAVTLTGTKTLNGRDIKDGEFSFTITGPSGYTETVKNTGNSFTFKALSFDAEGTYVYTVTEDEGNLGGITYDSTVYTVTVKVTDNGRGKLVATTAYTADGSNASAISFTNTYATSDATINLGGTKTLNGRDIRDGEFFFTITGPDNYTETVKNVGNAFAFKTISFSKAGTYVYTVTENAGNLGGVTYDNTVYVVTVKVTDNGNGELVAGATYARGNDTVSGISFTNSYSPASVTVDLGGSKELSGRDMKDGEFSFTIKGDSYSETVKNAGKTFTFAPITFDKAGTYVYTVTEKAGTLGGITYDTTAYTVTVVVTDDGNGKLVASVSYAKGNDKVDSISFKNTYSSTSVTVTVSGSKDLSGRDIKDGEFSFTIKGDNYSDTKKNVGNVFTFDTLTFDKAGTYVYTVTEDAGALGGVTYDTAAYTVTVVVTDNGEGKLVASVSYAKGNDTVSAISFVNTYSSTSATVTVSGNKDLDGRDMKDGEFSFTLNGNGTSDTKKNVGKTFTFDTLTFDKAGTYVYTVTEDEGTLGGITYDKTVYTVTVVVTDNGEGKLVASVSYAKGNDTATGITFNNGYKSSAVKVTFTGVKNLTGRDIKADEFTFMLFNADDKFTVNGEAFDLVKNLADGSFSFKALEFDKVGTWYYVVKEDTSAEEKGMTYDTTVYGIKVTVTDNGEGQLVASVEISTDEGAVNGITFNNVYEEPFVPSPDTGDETAIGLFLMMLTVTSIGFIAIKSKKRRIAE